jgi:hypothetical protein
MNTPIIPDEESHPDKRERLIACEKLVGGSDGTRARTFLRIRTQKLYVDAPGGQTYSSFEDYASERWGVRSKTHCDRLCAYGRFLITLDEEAGGTPMGDWSFFLSARAYREIDGLDVTQKEKAAKVIVKRLSAKVPKVLTGPDMELIGQEISKTLVRADEKCAKVDVTEGRPVEPKINLIAEADAQGLVEAANLIIRGAQNPDTKALVAGLLKILRMGPVTLREMFKCRQPNRVLAKAEGYLARAKPRKAA